MKRSFIIIVATAVSILALACPAYAQTAAIPYQGHLTDAGGSDLSDDVQIEVRLYDSLIAGIGQGVTNSHVVYAESHPVITVEKGNFSVAIGEGAPLNDAWTESTADTLVEKENIYLELRVNGERLSPRQKLGAVPAVFHAKYAKYADEVVNLPAVTEISLPNYPAELITSGTLDPNRIPNTLGVSLIEGELAESMIPASLSADMFDQIGSLPAELIGNMDAGKIVNGTINKEMFADGSYIARDDFFVMSGSVSNGQTLPLPPGFLDSEENSLCNFMLTPGVTMGSVEGIDQIYLSETDGVVRCEVDKYSNGQNSTAPCTANYMIICMRPAT